MEPGRVRRLAAATLVVLCATAPAVLAAQGSAGLSPGNHGLTVISDDGARVSMDGEVVLDAWAPHEPRIDRAQISGGKRFKVEYYDAGGFAELRFDIQRR